MFREKKYVGIALESNALKIAQVNVQNDTIKLEKVDHYNLVEDIKPAKEQVFSDNNGYTDYTDSGEVSEEEVFGFDEEQDSHDQEKEKVDFQDLEAQTDEADLFELGEIDEDSKPQSNFVLLYNVLSRISHKHINLAVNIPAGNTIFQVLDDAYYRDIKDKDIIERIEDKLQAIYGEKKSEDNYAYEVREDGSLVLASIDESPTMLHLVDETSEFYRGGLKIQEVYSDEVALIGLFRSNYDPHPGEITALLQFGDESCRVIFLQGEEIYLIVPHINEGTNSQDFLNLLFSKILFQLDSGEIPELNRIIIANNSLGERAVEFFKGNFSGAEVEEFQYKDTFLDKGKFDSSAVSPFTTAIAMGAAAVQKDETYPKLSLRPDYVRERQKIFKLQWHGMLLLILIFMTFPVANYFYQQNERQIQSLSTELERTNMQIEQIQPIVNEANEISQNLALLTSKLSVLDSLSTGSKAWSSKLDILNREMNRIPNSWFTSMSQTQDGAFIEGYTLYRNRIPAIVDIFHEATLLNVNTEVIREQELHKFSMIVQEFTADSSIYSPEKPERVERILNN